MHLILDEWACKKVELTGKDPTIKPGSRMYLALIEQALPIIRTFMYPQSFLHSGNKGKRMLIWSPPRTGLEGEDDLLANIINHLVGGQPFDASDARHVLAQYTEKLEHEAQNLGIVTVRCYADISTVHHTLDSMGALNAEQIDIAIPAILEEYQKTIVDQITVE